MLIARDENKYFLRFICKCAENELILHSEKEKDLLYFSL